MQLNKYITKRPRSPNWQLRIPVPMRYQAAYGRKEFTRSLGTTDLSHARRLAMSIWAELETNWQKLESQNISVCSDDIPLTRVYRPVIEQLNEKRKALRHDAVAYEGFMARQVASEAKLARKFHDDELDQWEPIADGAIAKHSLPIVKGSAEYRKLVEDMAQATIDALSVHNRRGAGDVNAQPQSEVIKSAIVRERLSASPGETLLDLFDVYADQRLAEGKKRADVLVQDRKVIIQFSDFVGSTKSVPTIGVQDVRQFRDLLLKLPTRWRVRQEFAGLDMRQAAVAASGLSLASVSMKTVNKYLSTLSPLFAWLIETRFDMPNPCHGLLYSHDRARNSRPPFSTDQLNAILRSPLFTGFLCDGKEHLRGSVTARDWRFWIPLVSLLTGARIGEIAQLRIDDVDCENNGGAFLHIRHDLKRQQVTKSGQSRFAIVHQRLVDVGFLVFVEKCRRIAGGTKDAKLFPELVENGRQQIGAKPSVFWRKYLAKIGIKDGADGLGAHSFRHTMADRLREEANLLDQDVAIALGHGVRTVTSNYGKVAQGTRSKLKEMSANVTFDGVDFDVLIDVTS